jgi:hypothetical protein
MHKLSVIMPKGVTKRKPSRDNPEYADYLMEGIKTPQDCANRSLQFAKEGQVQEAFDILHEGMIRFESKDGPSLQGLLDQYKRGGLSRLIRRDAQK